MEHIWLFSSKEAITIYNKNPEESRKRGGGGGGGGGTPYNSLYWEAPPAGGTFFHGAAGIWKVRDFTNWSIWKGKKIFHFGL